MIDQMHAISVDLKKYDHVNALDKYNRLASSVGSAEVSLFFFFFLLLLNHLSPHAFTSFYPEISVRKEMKRQLSYFRHSSSHTDDTESKLELGNFI
jgi:hypothetical protein